MCNKHSYLFKAPFIQEKMNSFTGSKFTFLVLAFNTLFAAAQLVETDGVNLGTQAVGFIGSIETGQKVASRAAGKTLLMEMGGNGPMVILDDADIEAAAEESLTSAFLGAGQSCTGGRQLSIGRLTEVA